MATGFNIVLPNGSVARTLSSSYDERVKICNTLLEQWKTYCLTNWLSVNDHPYSPQNKVKMFLSSLGYFLISGGGDEHRIVTRYKEVMNGKRQIPVSACPDYIEDEMYGLIHNGGSQTQFAKSQSIAFDEYMQNVDDRVTKKYKPRPHKKAKTSSLYDKSKMMSGAEVIRSIVDTDGIFTTNSVRYQIDMEHCKQYAAKIISQDEVMYDMDCVMCAVCGDGLIRFYDQDYNPIDQFVRVVADE